MHLAFSTNAYLNYSFAEAVRRLAAIGYRGVEIMADVPHAWPAFLLEEQKQAIRDALASNHLAISNVNAFMMHAVNDARQRYWHPSWIEPDRHYPGGVPVALAGVVDRVHHEGVDIGDGQVVARQGVA